MKRDTMRMVFRVHTPKPRYPVIREIQEHFSPRFFASAPVKQADIHSMLEAARWAPSGHNHQPWHFYFTRKGTKAYTDLFSTLGDYNKSWAKTAPLLILACAIPRNVHGENPFAYYDLGAAVISLILQVQSMGYYARQMGIFDKEKVKKLFSLIAHHEPFVIVAVGAIGDYNKAPKEIVEMERAPRPRKANIVSEL